MSHGTKSCAPGRPPQRRTRCRGGLQIAPLVRKKGRKDRLLASPLSKTVRMLRMNTKMMAMRMMTSFKVLKTIMLSLESSAKLNNPTPQKDLKASRPP